MIDFHTHILPAMDDGADEMLTSLKMLRSSFWQGVDVVVSTSHYYADEEYPSAFLKRRRQRVHALQETILRIPEAFPEIVIGAEVLYFPGISGADDVSKLRIEGTNAILIEPPMVPWQDAMLDDIAEIKTRWGLTPVIAHVDRFMDMLRNKKLIDRVLERDMLVQVNADYFLEPQSVRSALQNLKQGKIHLIGSDCHNLTTRAPNLKAARAVARDAGLDTEFAKLTQNAAKLLGRKEGSA